MKSAITAHFAPIPLLRGYPKTHKDLSRLTPETQAKGPPSRPVCGASESNKSPLSDLLSEICRQLGDEMDVKIKTICLSTEELIGGIEREVNTQKDIKKLVVKMFPSLVASKVAHWPSCSPGRSW